MRFRDFHGVTRMLVIASAIHAGAALAQPPAAVGSPGYAVASDFDGPYAAMPPLRRYDAPAVLPPRVVYDVLRENGYSPLGMPHQRGLVYTIAAINLDGDDGRLVIDARTGRIIRFMPAYRMGPAMDDVTVNTYGPPAALPPISDLRRPPRPPASIPRVASRPSSVPLPRATPPRAVAEPKPPAATATAVVKPSASAITATPLPAPRQSAAAQPAASAAPLVAAPKPPVQIQPTQDMPAVQALE